MEKRNLPMSSDDIVISARNLSKTYQIYSNPLHRIRQRLVLGKKKYYREFTALENLSFEIRKGETVGIIGRNGSGKSTLLQLVCGISKPTSGGVRVDGRISALLELGAGFHPEFTGRENVYMQGAIMGITRRDMDKRFPDIEAFADIGEFIEQPVKTYSSGMFVRLAFATIAHVDASVLVVDEALSVGDAQFTQKCLRYLRKFRECGTLLVVSHDINTITSLCDRVIWLDKGKIQAIGPTKQVCDAYLVSMFGVSRPPIDQPLEALSEDVFVADQRRDFINGSNLRNDLEIFGFALDSNRAHNGNAKIIKVELLDEDRRPYAWVVGGEKVTLRILAKTKTQLVAPIVGFIVYDRMGRALFGDNTYLRYVDNPIVAESESFLDASFTFQMPRLPVGDYSVTAAVAEGSQQHHIMHEWLPDGLLFRARTSSTSEVVSLPMINITLQTITTVEAVE
jgi:lipopolysaccharide transport system ATP-binding protein